MQAYFHRDFNVKTPDIKSVVTAFGLHNRVSVCAPRWDRDFGFVTLYARVDHVNGLRDPTEKEIIEVYHKVYGTKGRYSLLEKETFDCGKRTGYSFKSIDH